MKAIALDVKKIRFVENGEALRAFYFDGSEDRLPSQFRPGIWAFRRVDEHGYPVCAIYLGESEQEAQEFLEQHGDSVELAKKYGNGHLPYLRSTGYAK